jgi:Protein of unknown function (DUF3300)
VRPQKLIASLLIVAIWGCDLGVSLRGAEAQQYGLPAPDQLDQLLAPIALYPDQLVAQICAASTDPQQIIDADNWLHQNSGLTGQARSDAAQSQGFDPAFIALVNFPQILDMMAQNIDSYAAIGQAFSANQGTVMDSVQRLRQEAYASGALQTNQYQTVTVQPQGTTQYVIIQPANPQVVYVPQYSPQVVYAPPSTAAVVTTSLLTFGAGIALGMWISNNSYPWGWGGWGWNWGHRTVIVHNNVWVVNNRYRPRYPSYHYRPPVYNRPIYARPPNNWHDRPYYRPGGGPPAGGPGYRPPPPPGNRPPTNPTPLPGNPSRPPVNGPGNRPPGGNPGPGNRPPGNQNPPGSTPRPTPQPRPAPNPPQRFNPNPNAGYSKGPANSNTGGRTSAFGGGNNPASDRAAISRGKASVASQKGGGNRR